MGLAAANQNQSDSPSEWWRSLPFEYQSLKLTAESRPAGFRFSKHIVNIEAGFRNTHFLVCGEADSQEQAVTKAVAELLERTAMKSWVDENPHLGIENSNGFAAHGTEDLAREAAIFERVERDAVLAQWYSATPFLEIAPETLPSKLRNWSASELAQSEFPNLKILLSTQGLGPSITCILMNRDGFGVSGHSTKADLLESIESAVSEACRAAHLYLRRSCWSESLSLKSEAHNARKVKPGAHALYYAYHEPFPAWMFRREMSWIEAERLWANRMQTFAETEMPNFSFQALLREPLVVGFAHSSDCFDLTWGPCDPARILSSSANKRFASPINERSLNRQPHIVS